MWLQCQDPSRSLSETPRLNLFPKPRNISQHLSSILRLFCSWTPFRSLWIPLAQGSDLWNTDFTQIFGGLARLAGCWDLCVARGNMVNDGKCNEAGNCWWQMNAPCGNSDCIDWRLRQASTTCARDLTTWQAVRKRCLDYRTIPRHISCINPNPDSYLNEAGLISHVPTLIYCTRGFLLLENCPRRYEQDDQES